MKDFKQLNRWNVILGRGETKGGETSGLSEVLDFIYDIGDRERGSRGGQEKSKLTVPDWVARAKEILPQKGFDLITRHAIKKYGLTSLLTEETVLDRIQPDIEILREILTFKSVLDQKSMDRIKKIVKAVADELTKKMRQEVTPALSGAKKCYDHCNLGKLKNLDVAATIRKNLKTYDPASKRLYPDKMIFYRNLDKSVQKSLILLVDQSGSMIDSVINTAMLAGILSEARFLRVNVTVFDTAVVDLTDKCGDLTELLLSVQLGGGTDIGKALTYAEGLLTEPKKTAVILISDLCDGFGYRTMYAAAKNILLSGAKLLCLTAMDYGKGAFYDEAAAVRLMRMGAEVAAKTPRELCEWIVNAMN